MTNCDVLVIGSGHNGLGLAAYCARAGLDVVVVEAAPAAGGLLSTEEATLPGFKHNLHAITLGSYAPFYCHFDLKNFGLSFVKPPVEYVALFPQAHLIIRCGQPVANFKALANFSRRDAQTIEDLYRRFHRAWLREYYSAPFPPGERGQSLPGGEQREYNRICNLSFREALDELYESEEIKLLFCLRCIEVSGDVALASKGAIPDYRGTGDLVFRLAFDEEYQICVGGTNELAQAIVRLIRSFGGRVITGAAVIKILVDGQKATGVKLVDGTTITARSVVSNSSFVGTMLELVGEEKLAGRFVEAVKNLRSSSAGKFDLHLAVTDAPRYRIPEAREALCLFLGYEGLGDIETRYAEIQAGEFPARPAFHCGCTTLHDPTCAPRGAHTLYLWQFVPGKISRAVAGPVAESYTERILAQWRQYTSDLSDRAILGRHAYYLGNWQNRQSHWGAVAYSHGQYYRGRPLAECSDYRTPIDGLYHCGASSHPGGNVRFAPAHNAAMAVLKDLGRTPWWSQDLIPGTPLVSAS